MLELMKRAYKRMVMLGKHPTKIVMRQEIMDMIESEMIQNEKHLSEMKEGYKEIFGMQIEVRDDLDANWLFYIS